MSTPSSLILPAQMEEAVARGPFSFVCPVCSKRFTYDGSGPPLCTGPNEGLDEHEPELMRRIR